LPAKIPAARAVLSIQLPKSRQRDGMIDRL